jgi:hypothetical protein
LRAFSRGRAAGCEAGGAPGKGAPVFAAGGVVGSASGYSINMSSTPSPNGLSQRRRLRGCPCRSTKRCSLPFVVGGGGGGRVYSLGDHHPALSLTTGLYSRHQNAHLRRGGIAAIPSLPSLLPLLIFLFSHMLHKSLVEMHQRRHGNAESRLSWRDQRSSRCIGGFGSFNDVGG